MIKKFLENRIVHYIYSLSFVGLGLCIVIDYEVIPKTMILLIGVTCIIEGLLMALRNPKK